MAAPARVRNRSVERRKKLQGGHPTGWAKAGVTSTRPSLEGQGLRTRPSAHIGRRKGRSYVQKFRLAQTLEATRSANKSCKWLAEAIVNGRTYTATSRMAPANDIARQIVADGVPDAPMRVYTAGLKGALVWRSFHKAAGYTIEETTTKPVHMARCESPEVRYRRGPKRR